MKANGRTLSESGGGSPDGFDSCLVSVLALAFEDACLVWCRLAFHDDIAL